MLIRKALPLLPFLDVNRALIPCLPKVISTEQAVGQAYRARGGSLRVNSLNFCASVLLMYSSRLLLSFIDLCLLADTVLEIGSAE